MHRVSIIYRHAQTPGVEKNGGNGPRWKDDQNYLCLLFFSFFSFAFSSFFFSLFSFFWDTS